jgi:hypothetical protein
VKLREHEVALFAAYISTRDSWPAIMLVRVPSRSSVTQLLTALCWGLPCAVYSESEDVFRIFEPESRDCDLRMRTL